MIIKTGSEQWASTVIKDEDGNVITNVIEFNTETKDAVILVVMVREDKVVRAIFEDNDIKKMLTINCILLNCKAFDKTSGSEIK